MRPTARPVSTGVHRFAAGVVVLTLAFLAPGASPVSAKTPGPNGQIAFYQDNGDDRGPSSVFAINPDGSHQRLVRMFGNTPRWSPDGRQVSMECDDCTGSAVIVDLDTGVARVLPNPDPGLGFGLGCQGGWSPDGSRLLCGTFTDDSSLEGMYTVRSSDGGDVTRLTTFGQSPGDYSPDGAHVTFVGYDENDEVRLYTVSVGGGVPTAITPAGMTLVDDFGGTWSPAGNDILFVARPTPTSRRAIWAVHPDGTSLRELPIPGCGGRMDDVKSIGCDSPSWAPDGSRIAFARYSNKTHLKDIYTVRTDGSDLVQVTHTGRQDFGPDWGTRPTNR
jgi:Tol biopolymer transport system component